MSNRLIVNLSGFSDSKSLYSINKTAKKKKSTNHCKLRLLIPDDIFRDINLHNERSKERPIPS